MWSARSLRPQERWFKQWSLHDFSRTELAIVADIKSNCCASRPPIAFAVRCPKPLVSTVVKSRHLAQEFGGFEPFSATFVSVSEARAMPGAWNQRVSI